MCMITVSDYQYTLTVFFGLNNYSSGVSILEPMAVKRGPGLWHFYLLQCR